MKFHLKERWMTGEHSQKKKGNGSFFQLEIPKRATAMPYHETLMIYILSALHISFRARWEGDTWHTFLGGRTVPILRVGPDRHQC